MIFKENEEQEWIEKLRSEGKKLVVTNGCFDLLHSGHTSYLEEASKLGDVLLVGCNSDRSVRELKGSTRPINTEEDRVAVLLALRSVDAAYIYDEKDACDFLELTKPDIYVKGGDYSDNWEKKCPVAMKERAIVEKHGGTVKLLSLSEGKSTTELIRKIASQSTTKREKYEDIWETALEVELVNGKPRHPSGKKSVWFKAQHGKVGKKGEVIDSEEKFGLWMGGPFSKNREDVRELFSKKAKTILDVACGAGPEYFGLQESRPDLKYTGLDITPKLVSYCQSKGINAVLGTANSMLFDDSSFDIVHTRHSLEHMKDFRDALSEFVRVARKNVFVSFFIKPSKGSKKITDVRPNQDLEFYNNRYDKLEIEDFLNSMTKARTYQWIDIHEGVLLKIEVSGLKHTFRPK